MEDLFTALGKLLTVIAVQVTCCSPIQTSIPAGSDTLCAAAYNYRNCHTNRPQINCVTPIQLSQDQHAAKVASPISPTKDCFQSLLTTAHCSCKEEERYILIANSNN